MEPLNVFAYKWTNHQLIAADSVAVIQFPQNRDKMFTSLAHKPGACNTQNVSAHLIFT